MRNIISLWFWQLDGINDDMFGLDMTMAICAMCSASSKIDNVQIFAHHIFRTHILLTII